MPRIGAFVGPKAPEVDMAGETWVLIGCSPASLTAASEESGREASSLADLTRPDAPWESSSSSAAESYLVADHGVAGAETSAVALLGGIWPASGLKARIRRAESDLLRSAVRLLPSVDVSRTNYDAADFTAIQEDPTTATSWSSPTTDTLQAIQETDLGAWTADAGTGERRHQIWIALRRKSATYVETTTGPKISLDVWDGVSAWVPVLISAWIPAQGVYSLRFDAAISSDITATDKLRIRITVDPGASDTLEVGGVALVPDYDDHVYDSGWIAAVADAPRLVDADDDGFGSAIRFAADGRVDFGDVLDQTTADFSIQIRLRRTTVGARQWVLARRASGLATSPGYSIFIESSGNLKCEISDGVTEGGVLGPIVERFFETYTMVVDQGSDVMTLYRGESSVGTDDISAVGSLTVALDLVLADKSTGGDEAVVDIEEFRFWSKALSPTEVAANYDAPIANPETEASLELYWAVDEGEGDVAGDDSTNGRHGSITGGTWLNPEQPDSAGIVASSFLHPFLDNGTPQRQSARYTLVELDPTIIPTSLANATRSIHWQYALGGLDYASRQLWAVYWEGPGIAGDGLRGVTASPAERGASVRAIDGTLHTVQGVDGDELGVELTGLLVEEVGGQPAVGVEVWEILERVGAVFPVGMFVVPWSSEDMRRVFSAVGVVRGQKMTMIKAKTEGQTTADQVDVSFRLREIGGR